MKKIFLLLLLFISLNSFSQIFPGYGLYPIDTCSFEILHNRLVNDTLNSNNNWEIGSTNKPFFGQATSLPNAIMTDSLNPYSPNNLSSFDITFGLNDSYFGLFFNMYIKFDHKYETDTLIDGGFITVSYDTGQTWINVVDEYIPSGDFFSDNSYTHNDTLQNGNFGFSGTSDWKTTALQWIWMYPVKQQPVDTFIIRYNFISDSIQTNKDGWIIDNIIIGYADLGSSIDELPNYINVKLFPNITSDYFNYRVENNEHIESMVISNINGAIVLTIENPKSEGGIDVSNLSSGNYFVKFSTKEKTLVKRLVIN
jgi:hypothetical protein